MSGFSIDTPHNAIVRDEYNNRVFNAIQIENALYTGEPDNTMQKFGSLYTSQEYNPIGFGRAQLEQTETEKSGGFIPLLFMPMVAAASKLLGKGKEEQIVDDSNMEGGLSFMEVAMPGYALAKKIGIIGGEQPESEGIHIDINSHTNEKPKSKAKAKSKRGGRAPTGADFSGADIINSEPIKNQGPEVGQKAKIPGLTPSTNAGQGVNSWTDYPNKEISKQDMTYGTATAKDLQNKVVEEIADKKKGKGRPKKKKGGFNPLNALTTLGDTLQTVSDAVPFLDKATKSITGIFGMGKTGAGVASPDIALGERAPINAGILKTDKIDGFEDPRTTGMSSQANKQFDGSGKKTRKRIWRKNETSTRKKTRGKIYIKT
jgi:hypothetical protein